MDLRKVRPSLFFLTYDEPLKDQYWQQVQQQVPWAERVDGIKGFDAAHKECARRAKTERFFVVDGDNLLHAKFLSLKLPWTLSLRKGVFSWPARNSINGLIYGNGGIKNWSRSTVLSMQSHESAHSENMALDFCFGIQYLHQSQVLSTAHVGQTPFQAFRSGFREGVKMSLSEGLRLPFQHDEDMAKLFAQKIPKSNLERLKIWCSVGSDTENGLWAILGARWGCHLLLNPEWDMRKIHCYDWFRTFWEEEVLWGLQGNERSCSLSHVTWSEKALMARVAVLGEELQRKLNLNLVLLDPSQSQFFKSVYQNRPRIPGGPPVWN